MTNTNEKMEWWRAMVDEMNDKVAIRMALPNTHAILSDVKEMVNDLAELFVTESANREMERCISVIHEAERKLDKRYGWDAHVLNALRDLEDAIRLDSLDNGES